MKNKKNILDINLFLSKFILFTTINNHLLQMLYFHFYKRFLSKNIKYNCFQTFKYYLFEQPYILIFIFSAIKKKNYFEINITYIHIQLLFNFKILPPRIMLSPIKSLDQVMGTKCKTIFHEESLSSMLHHGIRRYHNRLELFLESLCFRWHYSIWPTEWCTVSARVLPTRLA